MTKRFTMFSQRWLQILHRSGWEFWLPLPLIAGLVWVAGNQIVAQVLVQPYEAIDTLQAASSSDFDSTILTINVQIDRARTLTKVAIRIADPTLRTVEYEFAATEVTEIEQAIAQKLNVSVADVRALASYRIQN